MLFVTTQGCWVHGVLSRCRSQVSETMCGAIYDVMHLKGIGKLFCKQSDSHSGLGEETCDTPDFVMSGQSSLS